MLAQGGAKGGVKAHQQNRYDALERLRRVGHFTEDQKGQWKLFKTSWDEAQATEHGANLGKVFAESINSVLFNLLHGERDAFSKVVKNGIERVSGEKGALVVPGFPSPTGIAQWSG